ncbi:anthranilate phosphoribosyltransferase [Fulvivirga sedimenti]|uniref:Anthranilate phosphoribosyltransferase n=1 Tax=Fulvivirga sedimenti TaxID=2879465 RepID=A0A9X1HKK0_9BACT|nr:anthranilate phosphoribosyltransferase [Fulvivirga sedimenti]MCA6073581.1 anthranilate phosphoribosyltransferase [Fulvivirga sedimenti]
MKEIINKLIEHKSLDKETAKDVLTKLAQGAYNNSQVAAFLTIYMMRSIRVEELEGFRDAMLDLCLPLDLSEFNPIDLCGTGGDGKNTFNISTLSSFVVAGAGQPVAKHGNSGVSSVCGSSNLLQHFGYEFTNNKDELRRSIEDANICFLHAPLFHPAMKNVAPIRRDLGVKTFFNMLGPMVNPAFPRLQLVGVFSLELARLYGYLYQNTDKSFVVLHTLDGYDEISLTGPFKMITGQGERLVNPEDLGLSAVLPAEIRGGETIEESARIFEEILRGNGTKAQNDVIAANAGMALYCASEEVSMTDAVEAARESLLSGKALEAFKKLINK